MIAEATEPGGPEMRGAEVLELVVAVDGLVEGVAVECCGGGGEAFGGKGVARGEGGEVGAEAAGAAVPGDEAGGGAEGFGEGGLELGVREGPGGVIELQGGEGAEVVGSRDRIDRVGGKEISGGGGDGVGIARDVGEREEAMEGVDVNHLGDASGQREMGWEDYGRGIGGLPTEFRIRNSEFRVVNSEYSFTGRRHRVCTTSRRRSCEGGNRAR